MRYLCVIAILTAGRFLSGSPSCLAAEPDYDEQAVKEARVGTDGPALLEFLRRRTLGDADKARVLALIQKLGDDAFAVREQASTDLAALGVMPVPLLRQALQHADVEIARRAEGCLERIDKQHQPPSAAVSSAVARLVGKRKPASAAAVLLAYLPFADDAAVIDDVRSALAAVAQNDGKPEPALVRGLTEQSALKRGAAAEALVRGGGAEAQPAARRLLQDPEPLVRLWVALAMAEARVKEAVPVLIALLAELPQEQGWQAEEVLLRLAAEKAPATALGSDVASRRKCRDAWAAWWQENEARVDLAQLANRERLLGYTLLVTTDNQGAGVVQELGPDRKPRWSVPGLQFVIDAQVLPGNRVLLAEYNGNRVTERNLKGEVLWQHALPMPFHCQRLANGNTFMACRNQMLEVDRGGKVVFTHPRNGQDLMAAQKLPNGQVVFITANGTCQRMDAGGKIVKTFAVGQVQTFVRIHVLPNGRILIPQYGSNKVVEYDGEGKLLSQVGVPNPTSVMRLPNGHTLIASLSGQRLFELDRAGKEIWAHQPGGQVWRAWRR